MKKINFFRYSFLRNFGFNIVITAVKLFLLIGIFLFVVAVVFGLSVAFFWVFFGKILNPLIIISAISLVVYGVFKLGKTPSLPEGKNYEKLPEEPDLAKAYALKKKKTP